MSIKLQQDIIRFPIRKLRSQSVNSDEYINKVEAKSRPTKSNIFSKDDTGIQNVVKGKNVNRKKEHKNNAVDQENLPSPTKKSRSTREDSSSLPREESCNSVLENQTERTPLKSVHLNFSRQSPSNVNQCTPPKNYIRSSPQKACKALNLDSPVRRSPRKLDFKKPDLINSPSTLISRLGLSSPKKTKTNIGLHKPELNVYQSLRTSFAQNCNNRIVGRETEVKFLEEFLQKHLTKCIACSLYISGAPGTGKTASVTKIVDELQDLSFRKVFVNCMSKKSSKEIFSSIAESLNLSTNRTERELVAQIEKALTTSKIPILIILDEVDQLESKNQKVLYTLFEWPSLSKSKLVLIGIANMLDLTDRILPRLQASHSCRPILLHFPPYSKAEIVQIINDRIKEAEVDDIRVINPSAIHFLAAKVSAVAGDVRRALDVCRRAVELSEIEYKKQMRLIASKSPSKSPRKSSPILKQVDIPKILSIFNEIYGSRVTAEIVENPNSFPVQQKVLICCLLLILQHSKIKNVNLGRFHEVYSRVCVRQKLPSVEQSEFFSLCTLLESRGMLQVKKSKELRNSKILLRLNEEEAKTALADKNLLATILDDKDSLMKSAVKR